MTQSHGEQMYTEVEVLSRVQHPNIVPLLGWSEEATPCVVYALMEGGSLEERLACTGGCAPLTASERMIVLSDVARGLAFLHTEVRVIHRDVKSSNVLIDRGCVGRIGDFGIAKCVSSGKGMTATHLHTQPIGTKGVQQ
jgi:serine/threonine protein kinase